MRDVSLVLSSGGARGLAHIGAIEELEDRGYHISSITGCSMGALVGGMYAAGRLAEYKKWMQTIDKRKMFSLIDFSLSINHIVKGERVIEALKEVVPDVNIEDLPIQYQAVAANWENGREVVFRSGSLYEAIRASISIPLFFNPVRRDDMILVDGGVLNPLPLKQGRSMKGNVLVAVNVSGTFECSSPKTTNPAESRQKRSRTRPLQLISSLLPTGIDVNYITMTQRMVSLMIQQNAAISSQLYQPDILVEIPMNQFGSFDYDQVDMISSLGRAKMRKALQEYEGFPDSPLD